MAIRKIARMGHPVLRRPTALVVDPTAPDVARLIADMVETMVDADGVGIAAPQVYEPLKIVMFYTPEDGARPDDLRDRDLAILINPVVTVLGDSREEGWEGCLSVPGLRGAVARPAHIGYRALAPDGRTIEREARGFHARVVQHECDHLDGVLYPMQMDDMAKLVFTSEWKHFAAAEGLGDGEAGAEGDQEKE
jgi:peptide deformylase